MMAQATSFKPPFRTFLVYCYSQLTRSVDELRTLREELGASGLELFSVTEH